MNRPPAPPSRTARPAAGAFPPGPGGGSPHQISDPEIESARDDEQVHVLDAVPRLDALDSRPPQLGPLGEPLLSQVGVKACPADAVTLLLAGVTDPGGLIVGHPSKFGAR